MYKYICVCVCAYYRNIYKYSVLIYHTNPIILYIGRKLRSFQALCILTPIFDTNMISSNNILYNYYSILGDNCVHTIRMYIEVFGAALCHITPIYMLSTLIQQLQDFNHTQQKLASLFIILGHICIDSSSSGDGSSKSYSDNSNCIGSGGVGTNNSDTSTINNTNSTNSNITTATNTHTNSGTGNAGARIDSKVLTLTIKRQICHLLIAWSSCASGLPRAIAQLVIYTLGAQIKAATSSTTNTTTNSTCIGTHTPTITDALQVAELRKVDVVAGKDIVYTTSNTCAGAINSTATTLPSTKVGTDSIHTSEPVDPLDTSIYQVCNFLELNRDSIKMLQRQQGFFSEYSLSTRCTLLGLLDVQRRDSDNTGDNYSIYMAFYIHVLCTIYYTCTILHIIHVLYYTIYYIPMFMFMCIYKVTIHTYI